MDLDERKIMAVNMRINDNGNKTVALEQHDIHVSSNIDLFPLQLP